MLKRVSLFWAWVSLLFVLIVIGLSVALYIMINGLGVTNMSDTSPWGLWIVLDLSCIGLAAGAFTISAITYILGRDKYKPLARIAVFIGLLGYSGALMALVMDIGRPDRFWHGWVYWNTHSMLWEVTMCITLYFSVLLLEVFPMVVEHRFFDRFPWLQRIAHRVHHYAPVLAIIGLCLSLLHQSSLGATYGVVIGRSALWRSTMPLLFIVSAAAVGMAFTIHITLIVQWFKGRILVPLPVLFEVGQIAGGVLLFYLYMRFWDTTAGTYGYVPGRTEAENVLLNGEFAVSFWAWEMILGGVVAATLLIRAKARQSVSALLVGSGLAMAGLVFNRWHTTLLAFTQPLSDDPPVTNSLEPLYSPALSEWLIVMGILAILALVFSLGMKFIPAFNQEVIGSIGAANGNR